MIKYVSNKINKWYIILRHLIKKLCQQNKTHSHIAAFYWTWTNNHSQLFTCLSYKLIYLNLVPRLDTANRIQKWMSISFYPVDFSECMQPHAFESIFALIINLFVFCKCCDLSFIRSISKMCLFFIPLNRMRLVSIKNNNRFSIYQSM